MRSPWASPNDPRIAEGQLDLIFAPRSDPAREQVGRAHHDGTDTEWAAARRVAPRSGTQRAKVLDSLRHAGVGGRTDYELWRGGIGARPHVPATRREELIAGGWPIVDSGLRRKTDTGSPAIVWVLREET
jgi:hypothetical protein